MKKILLLLVLVTGIGMTAYSQIVKITCTEYKDIERINGSWEKWPSRWSDLTKETVIQISKAAGSKYRIEYIIAGKTKLDYYVIYDATETAKVRKNNDNQRLYCYVDDDGDSIWTDGFSLLELVEDVSIWSKSGSNIYFWDDSIDYAELLR